MVLNFGLQFAHQLLLLGTQVLCDISYQNFFMSVRVIVRPSCIYMNMHIHTHTDTYTYTCMLTQTIKELIYPLLLS